MKKQTAEQYQKEVCKIVDDSGDDDNQQFIKEIDSDLSDIENVASGKAGDMVSALRGKIQKFLYPSKKQEQECFYITPTGALISEHDYNHLSDNQKLQCKIFNQ